MADDGLDTKTRAELLAMAEEHKVVMPPGYVTHLELCELIRQAQASASPQAFEPPQVPERPQK